MGHGNAGRLLGMEVSLDGGEERDRCLPQPLTIGPEAVTGQLRAAALVEPSGIRLSSHLFPEVSVHLMAATPSAHWLEYLDLASPVLQEPLRIENGYAIARDTPGSGIAWDEEAVSRFLVA